MPWPSQICLDHFSRSAAAAKEVFGDRVIVSQGLWHMRWNILKNNNAGHRRRLRESEGLLQKPKKAKRAGKPAKADKPPPHLRNRPVYAFLGLLVDLFLMPTRAFSHLCLSKIKARILRVWQEPEFLAYFDRVYLTTSRAHLAKDGADEFLSATWWCGLGSKTLLARPATIVFRFGNNCLSASRRGRFFQSFPTSLLQRQLLGHLHLGSFLGHGGCEG